MACSWNTTVLRSERDVLHVLADLRGKRWLCRGQPSPYGVLIPSIDRGKLQDLPRAEKLMLERQSIDLFRSTARFFATAGEGGALVDDVIALMVLRHHKVPTRLLDWSLSPYVAAYFATCENDKDDGELWSFDEPLYEIEGAKQWRRWPETTSDGSGHPSKFSDAMTAFSLKEPPDWFVCRFYKFYPGFPRQDAQAGAYSMTARFGRNHAEAIAQLLQKRSRYHRYVVSAKLKPMLQRRLRESHGIWVGSLFPDTAGAADTARTVFSGYGS